MLKKLLFCLFSVLLSYPIYAQNTKFTTEDDAFFESQMPYLQQWLNDYKMGEVLKADKLITDLNEGIVTVFLMLDYQTADSAIAAYRKLKTKFAEKNTLPLESMLFYKTTQLMEVNASQLHLIIADKVECRTIIITLTEGAIKVKDVVCRAVTQKVDIKDYALKNPFVFTNSLKNITSEPDAVVQENTLKKIKEESQKYFTGRKKAVFNFLGLKDGLLRFEVNDIKQEILRDGNLFDKYEMISFSISCQKINSDTRISFVIDAKSGASFPWKPRISAFTPIDATKHGKYQMEKYAYLFGAMVEQWLSK